MVDVGEPKLETAQPRCFEQPFGPLEIWQSSADLGDVALDLLDFGLRRVGDAVDQAVDRRGRRTLTPTSMPGELRNAGFRGNPRSRPR